MARPDWLLKLITVFGSKAPFTPRAVAVKLAGDAALIDELLIVAVMAGASGVI